MYYMQDCRIQILPLKKAIEVTGKMRMHYLLRRGIGYCHTDHEEGAPLAYLLK